MPRTPIRAQPALKRIYHLLELYLTSIETSFNQTQHSTKPENEARMLNALARTLEKLAKLEQAFASQSDSVSKRKQTRQSIHHEIERRIARLMDEGEAAQIPDKPE